MIGRRKFINIAKTIGIGTALSSSLNSCKSQTHIAGKIMGPNASLGHRLRSMDFPPPSSSRKTEFAIIGGGVAGLTAARYLKKFTDDFVLLELDSETGGNSRGGQNKISAYPWGAHYLPLPNNNDPELIAFLSDVNVITGIKNGLPVFNEYFLCHDPKERLFINNFWQEGLIPHEGVPTPDRDQIQRFLSLMNDYRSKIGSDNKAAFTIPIADCSVDATFTALDYITAEAFLIQNRFTSPYLLWYINYCCADDFGSGIKDTSAWAMIHYFASRNGKAFNAAHDAVLTWPEGNAWLATQLRRGLDRNIETNELVFNVSLTEKDVTCLVYNPSENRTTSLSAARVIMATPQFINRRIIPEKTRSIDYSSFQYSPWMVANVTTDEPLSQKRGEPLSWDNVIYGSDSLGYVNASHQHVGYHEPGNVLTYYKPVLSQNVDAARSQIHQTSHSGWVDMIVQDLNRPHPGFAEIVKEVNIWLWGHGMIRPSPGLIHGDIRRKAAASIADRIFFAHSDLSGLSIFEEAFFHGLRAAKQASGHEAV